MDAPRTIVLLFGAYLLGSVPVGLLLGKWFRGIDIREHGSGNIGATNAGRILGKGFGAACLVLDVCKGLAPSLVAGSLLGVWGGGALAWQSSLAWVGAGGCAIVGHVFPVWLGFKGGKGVATGLGSMLGVWPYVGFPACAALAVWWCSLRLTRYVGVSSCLAAIALPTGSWLYALLRGAPMAAAWPFIAVTSCIAALVVYRHLGNLARTLAGTEPKVGEPASSPDIAA